MNEIHIREDLQRLECDSASEIKHNHWSWTIEGDVGEWELTICHTSRQDGKTSWAVILTQIDDVVSMIQGLDPWGLETALQVARAIRILTQDWIEPFKVFITT